MIIMDNGGETALQNWTDNICAWVIVDYFQEGLRLTAWWKSLRILRLGLRTYFLFPMMEEVQLRSFVSSVNLLIAFSFYERWILDSDVYLNQDYEYLHLRSLV